MARGKKTCHQEFIDLYEASDKKKDEFYSTAREDLGVTSGEIPRPDRTWLPPRDTEITAAKPE